jgi:hypothetical protein
VIRFSIVCDASDGLDESDRDELADLLSAMFIAPEDDLAWRPMCRARRLAERARVVVGQKK